jgi:hypothetical protein
MCNKRTRISNDDLIKNKNKTGFKKQIGKLIRPSSAPGSYLKQSGDCEKKTEEQQQKDFR